MKLPLKWIILGLLALLLGAGAVRTLGARASAKQALQTQLEAQKQPAVLELAQGDVLPLRRSEISQVLPISGALRAVNSAFVKARAVGEIQALSLREGDFVRAGQVTGRIEAAEYQSRLQQAQQQAEAARAQMEIAQRTLDNNQALVNQGFISRTALDTALNNLAGARATYQAAQAGTDLARKALEDTVLRAPIDGQVAQRLVQNGERVALDARVLEIVDLRALELEAPLSAADSVRIRVGQTAQLTVEGLGQPLTARVARINPSTVAGSRSVLVYLSLQATPGLRQGLFAQGTLSTGHISSLAVPLDALRTDQPQPYVQLLAGDKVVHQQVGVGASGEREGQPMVELQGLAEGALVLRGAVGALPAGTLVRRAPVVASGS